MKTDEEDRTGNFTRREKERRRTMTSEEVRTTILSNIDYILGCINSISTRSDDLKAAQTVLALSEAYKNLEVTQE